MASNMEGNGGCCHGQLTGASKFRFSCHENLSCFGDCCRDITILLTPYDVLRLKNRLALSSQEFLDEYTLRLPEEHYPLPLIFVKMREEESRKCPFLSRGRCGVYMERPWSCRMAPVEIRGDDIYGFCFDRTRCHGLREKKEQTVREWMRGQGVADYEQTEEGFRDIPLKLRFTGDRERDRLIRDIFFMTCYNQDAFRKYVFETGFLEAFSVSGDVADAIRDDDIELMKFGFKWLSSGFDLKKAAELMKELN